MANGLPLAPGETASMRYHWKHREERREYAKRYYASNRALINEAKDVPCKRCGESFPAVCMDFHHRDRNAKSFGIGARALSFGPKRLTAEIEKCDVYCANCHRIIEHSNDEGQD